MNLAPAPRPVRLAPLLVAAAVTVAAPPLAGADEGPIQDNSFLIEEAYNQEAGVIQHISTFARGRDGGWVASFTEEWPVLGQTHQASVTFTAANPANFSGGMGDVALNYRIQAIGSGDTAVAFAPRLSVLLPTGDSSRGLGAGGAGLQVNLPLSAVVLDRLVTHWNLGGTWVPSARDVSGAQGASTSLAAGGSVVGLVHPSFNLMLEALYTTAGLPGRTSRVETLTVNPGLRAAINVEGGLQIVPGVAFPVGVGPSSGERGVFFYLSFEHPFRPAGPTEPRS